MTTAQVFKNLGKFIEMDEKKIGQGIKIVIRYTQPNYQDKDKVWEMGKFEDQMSEELLDKLGDLTPGQEYCIHTVKNAAGYGELHDVTSAKDVPQKSSGGSYQKKSGGGNWQPKDETGIAVGAAWANAIEVLKLEGGAPAGESTVEIVDKLAWDILQRKLAHEKKLRANKAKDTPVVAEAKKEEEKPMSKLEQMKAKKAENKQAPKPEVEEVDEIDTEDNLDDIEF